MSRIEPVDPAASEGKAKELFDGPLKSMQVNFFKTIMQSPPAAQAFLAARGALNDSTLSPQAQEVVMLAVSEANGCAYCVRAHTAIGEKVGLTGEQAVEARRGAMSDPDLGAIAALARAVVETNGRISDEQFAAARSAELSDAAIVDVTVMAGLANLANSFAHVAQLEPDFPPVAEL